MSSKPPFDRFGQQCIPICLLDTMFLNVHACIQFALYVISIGIFTVHIALADAPDVLMIVPPSTDRARILPVRLLPLLMH